MCRKTSRDNLSSLHPLHTNLRFWPYLRLYAFHFLFWESFFSPVYLESLDINQVFLCSLKSSKMSNYLAKPVQNNQDTCARNCARCNVPNIIDSVMTNPYVMTTMVKYLSFEDIRALLESTSCERWKMAIKSPKLAVLERILSSYQFTYYGKFFLTPKYIYFVLFYLILLLLLFFFSFFLTASIAQSSWKGNYCSCCFCCLVIFP